MSGILLHIGYPKAGSTFLGEWFHRNPAFIFRDFSLGGFTDTADLMRYSALHDHREKRIFVVRDMRFSSPWPDNYKEPGSIEEFQQRTARTLFSLFPRAKVLIVTRGFESAIKAKYSQYLKEGGRLKFSAYIDKGRNSQWLPFNYTYLADLYTGLFGKDHVLVIPFELLKKDPLIFLKRIEGFLGLEHFPYRPEKKNESLTPRTMTLIRKMNHRMYWGLFIFGPLQPLIYRFYIKILDHRKTSSWNNRLIKVFSRFSQETNVSIPADELYEKFSRHAAGLKGLADYEDLEMEYLMSRDRE